jgi:hypothetical protein
MWIIYGTYRRQKEEIDTAADKQEKDYLVREYRLAYGGDWTITAKKVKEGKHEKVAIRK